MQLQDEINESLDKLFDEFTFANQLAEPEIIKYSFNKIIDHPQCKEAPASQLSQIFEEYYLHLEKALKNPQSESSEVYNDIWKIGEFLVFYKTKNIDLHSKEVNKLMEQYFSHKKNILYQLAENTYQQKKYLEAEQYYSHYLALVRLVLENNMPPESVSYVGTTKVFSKLKIIVNDLYLNRIGPLANQTPEQYFQAISTLWQQLKPEIKNSSVFKFYINALNEELRLLQQSTTSLMSNNQKVQESKGDDEKIIAMLKDAVQTYSKATSKVLLSVKVTSQSALAVKEKLISLCVDVERDQADKLIKICGERIYILNECCTFFTKNYKDDPVQKKSPNLSTYQMLSDDGVIDLTTKRSFESHQVSTVNIENAPQKKQKTSTKEQVKVIDKNLKNYLDNCNQKELNKKNLEELQEIKAYLLNEKESMTRANLIDEIMEMQNENKKLDEELSLS